jgi:hypothetical protein
MGYNHVFQVCAMFGRSFQTVIAFLKYICLEITFFYSAFGYFDELMLKIKKKFPEKTTFENHPQNQTRN